MPTTFNVHNYLSTYIHDVVPPCTRYTCTHMYLANTCHVCVCSTYCIPTPTLAVFSVVNSFLRAPRCSSQFPYMYSVAESSRVWKPTPQDTQHMVLFNPVHIFAGHRHPTPDGLLFAALKNLSNVLGTFGPLAVQLFPLHNETIHDRIHQHSRQGQRLNASKTFNENQTRVSVDTTQFAQDSTVHNRHTCSWTIAQHNVGLNLAIQRYGFAQTSKSGPDGGTPTLADFSGPCNFVKGYLKRWRWTGTIAVTVVALNVPVCPCFGFWLTVVVCFRQKEMDRLNVDRVETR